MGAYPLLVTSGGQDWRRVQTCSPEDLTVQPQTPLMLTSGGYLLEHIQWARAVRILVECFLVSGWC